MPASDDTGAPSRPPRGGRRTAPRCGVPHGARQGDRGGPRTRHAVERRSPAGGGPARHGQDAPGQVPRHRRGRSLRAGPVHARPVAHRHHRHLGVSPGDGSWAFRPGPVFANIVLIDEVNRASPRTQAALLEPMEEGQVTVDSSTHPLPRPFFCIATQNPHGQVGTFPLPESQLDRFSLVLTMGLPDRAAEREILTGQGGVEVAMTQVAVTDPDRVAAAQAAVHTVYCAPAVIEYVLDLAEATRSHPDLTVGASPRRQPRTGRGGACPCRGGRTHLRHPRRRSGRGGPGVRPSPGRRWCHRRRGRPGW